jgi:hypothetical protein
MAGSQNISDRRNSVLDGQQPNIGRIGVSQARAAIEDRAAECGVWPRSQRTSAFLSPRR